jgi:PII-like signaling protein
MYFILFVLHNVDLLEEVLDAWEAAGISGVTVLPSIGYASIKDKRSLQEDFPLIPSLDDIIEIAENRNRTLFSIVKNKEIKDKLLQATEKIVGDLNLPNSGVLAVMSVSQALGLDRR